MPVAQLPSGPRIPLKAATFDEAFVPAGFIDWRVDKEIDEFLLQAPPKNATDAFKALSLGIRRERWDTVFNNHSIRW